VKGFYILENKTKNGPLEKVLFWAVPLFAILIAFVVFYYGYNKKASKENLVENIILSKEERFPQRLVKQWAKVDNELEDCRAMGLIIRQIEEKGEYSFRAILVIPQEEGGDGFILVNDAGLCWVNGEENKPNLTNLDWFKKAIDENRRPDPPPSFPIASAGGYWGITPVYDGALIWGFLLSQHYIK
jgi:hypothetical protein